MSVDCSENSSVESIQCSKCKKTLDISLFSSADRRKKANGKDAVCVDCKKVKNEIKVHNRMAAKRCAFNCTVCGVKFEHGTENNLGNLTKSQKKNSTCSKKCNDLFIKAAVYVMRLNSINDMKIAKNFVIAKWFERSIKEHEKNIRIQKRAAA